MTGVRRSGDFASLGGLNLAMAHGSVQFIVQGISRQVYPARAARAGQEAVGGFRRGALCHSGPWRAARVIP